MAAPDLIETPEAISGFPRQARGLAGLSNTVNNALFGKKMSNMIWLGTSGNVSLQLENDTELVVPAPITGRWHAMPPFKRVNETNTHSTIVALIGMAFK